MSDFMKLQNGSDIRGTALAGVANEPVTITDFETFHITASFLNWLSRKLNKPVHELKITIGSDSRLSQDILLKGIFNGIHAHSATAYNCGLASTPSMFMSTVFEDIQADGAIMVTASHLPFNKNGMKFFTREGGLSKIDIKDILQSIAPEATVEESDKSPATYDLIARYSNHIVDFIRKEANAPNYNEPLRNLRIIVDAGNGSGGFFAEKVLQPLGAITEGSQFLDPDGRFPNHIPNPEDDDAIASIIAATLGSSADLGIIFDTDVDRAAVIDSHGFAINRNRLIALTSAITLADHPSSTIVTDSVTSTGLTQFIESLGGIHHRFKRGYKNVIDESVRLNETGIPSHLAIETSGHGAFSENYFLDDGAYIVTKILIQLAKLKNEGREISDLIATLEEPNDEAASRVRINLENFVEYGQKILKDFETLIINDSRFKIVQPNFEGIRVDFDIEGVQGFLMLRMSLHDPVIPINFEANATDGCLKAKEFVFTFLKQYEHLLLPSL